MGMAASQARYLSLTARKNNIEYQGQQINQERTVLSQQCTALYNSLLTIDVPTPPSTSDYTKIEYKGTQGATTFTVGNIKPSGEKYIVELKTVKTGNSLQSDYGTRKVERDAAGNVLTIGGFQAYKFDSSLDTDPAFAKYNLGSYRDAIANTFADKEPEDFYVYIDTSGTTDELKFALLVDTESLDGFTETFSYIPNGTFNVSEQKEDCDLEFDTAGRIKTISIPIYQYDSAGNIDVDPVTNERIILGYQKLDVEATKVTDEAAYNDAMAEYEFAQYEYDRKQQEINAKTEVIQKDDKNLELKLTRLDNERKAVDTELDAVKKVIEDNIDKSFKTFNG